MTARALVLAAALLAGVAHGFGLGRRAAVSRAAAAAVGAALPSLAPLPARADEEVGFVEAVKMIRDGDVARVKFLGSFGESADFTMVDGRLVHVRSLAFQPVGDRGPESLVAAVRNSGVPFEFSFNLSGYKKAPAMMSEQAKQQADMRAEKADEERAAMIKMNERLEKQKEKLYGEQ
uniref:Uncharacterized protein n=1 Tax=Phaeomonas parva TaxID=124430 RepID=A0A7S1U5Q3_9STRA|mmetsp:Transcript_32932/g.104260  ORF Transcript_32932/g.104260 Transcript_32932/m.104260 type:complete len:177 (+) Transcript_32932:164-694(+)